MRCALSMSITSIVLLVLVLASTSAAATVDHPANVLLITVDTLRPDALGWVSGQNRTPVIDRLVREGFAFPSATAPEALTLPSRGPAPQNP